VHRATVLPALDRTVRARQSLNIGPNVPTDKFTHTMSFDNDTTVVLGFHTHEALQHPGLSQILGSSAWVMQGRNPGFIHKPGQTSSQYHRGSGHCQECNYNTDARACFL